MKRRDITLGEMQDECRKHEHGGCLNCTKCSPAIKKICDELDVDGFNLIDLTDPPRFTEAQMDFLRGCLGVGITGLLRNGNGAQTHFLTEYGTIGYLLDAEEMIPIKRGETLDLTELLGKDGAE